LCLWLPCNGQQQQQQYAGGATHSILQPAIVGKHHGCSTDTYYLTTAANDLEA
jgi:hypothetical protein